MKRMITTILILLSLCLITTPCFAAELTAPGNAGHDVYAQYHYSCDPNIYTAHLENGKYIFTTNDGITFTVIPSNADSNLMLVLHLVTNSGKEAYEWFASCTKEYGSKILPFDLYLIDANGNRVEMNDSMEISIMLPNGFGMPTVCQLNTNGKTCVLKALFSVGQVKFTIDHNSYYVITAKSASSPQTGCTSNIALWIIVTIFSIGILFTVARRNQAYPSR